MLIGYQPPSKVATTIIIPQRNRDTERSRNLPKVTQVLKERARTWTKGAGQELDSHRARWWGEGGRKLERKTRGGHTVPYTKLRDPQQHTTPSWLGGHPKKGRDIAPE